MAAKKTYGFPKSERLCRTGTIDRVFAEGRSFFSYPLRCVYLEEGNAPGKDRTETQVLFSVGKRNHKRAVRRNLLKRRLRESYRLNKSLLGDGDVAERLYICFVYTSKEVENYGTIENGVRKALKKIHESRVEGRRAAAPMADPVL